VTGWAEERPRDPRVDDRILEALSERAGRLAFNGLRRTLGLHPESLARALRRLERDGLVVRSKAGYALRAPTAPPRDGGAESRLIASVQLPPGAQRDDVLGRLVGRWFGDLRWVGLYEDAEDPRLAWSASGLTGQVLLSVRAGMLRVLAEGPEAEERKLEQAAYELLARAVEQVRAGPEHRTPGLATFDLEPRGPDLLPN
jgi:DNA-binding Lrp family transcriptional regulator